MNAYARLAEDFKDIGYSPSPNRILMTGTPCQIVAINRLRQLLPDAPILPLLIECWTADRHVSCAHQLARGKASAFASRFSRAGIPSAKQYLVATRLVRLREALDVPERSIVEGASVMGFSSGAMLARHIRERYGLTPLAWRKAYTASALLDTYFATMIEPHLETLRTVDPYAASAS